MITKNLMVISLIFVIFLLFPIMYLLRKKMIPIKYALVWLFSILIMLLVVITPDLMHWFASFLGFELVSNMILCIFIGVLLFLTLTLTVMLSNQNKKITRLIEDVSLLEKEVEDKK